MASSLTDAYMMSGSAVALRVAVLSALVHTSVLTVSLEEDGVEVTWTKMLLEAGARLSTSYSHCPC